MYRRNLKAIIVAFVLVSGFGIGTAAHVSAADTMSPNSTTCISIFIRIGAR